MPSALISSKTAIVNDEFVRELVGGQNAVGRRIRIEATPYEPQIAFEIVGVARNTKYRDLREEFQPILFTPLSQAALTRPHCRIVIRSSSRLDRLATQVRSTLAGPAQTSAIPSTSSICEFKNPFCESA